MLLTLVNVNMNMLIDVKIYRKSRKYEVKVCLVTTKIITLCRV